MRLLLPLLVTAPLLAQDYIGSQQDGHFGASIAADGWTAIGAPHEDCNGTQDAGAVHVIDSEGAISVICSPAPVSTSEFGHSIALDGPQMAVGAPFEGSGAVYLYDLENGAWSHSQTLRPLDDPGDDARYGWATVLSDDLLIVGAPGHKGSSEEVGSVYVYVDRVLDAQFSDGNFHDRFGYSLAWNGSLLVVGVPGDDTGVGCDCACPGLAPCQGSGRVTVHTPDTDWRKIKERKSGEPYCREYFGTSMAWVGEDLAIGSPSAETHCDPPAGAIYYYDRSARVLEGPFRATDSEDGDFFGWSLAGTPDRILVGAYGASGHGRAYVLEPPLMTELERIEVPTPGGGDNMGLSVGFDGTIPLSGAPQDEMCGGPEDAGSVTKGSGL